MHDQFPVSIDLEITPPKGTAMEMVGKKGKPMFPSLYLTGAEGLADLPREGWALVHYKRRSLTMGERDDETCCSADLEIHEIRLPEKGTEDEMGDMGDEMLKIAKERGLLGNSSDEEEESDESSEESESLAPESDDENEK